MSDTDHIANTPEASLGSVTLAFGWDETKQRFQKACTFVDQIGEDDVPAVENAEQLVFVGAISFTLQLFFLSFRWCLIASNMTTIQTIFS